MESNEKELFNDAGNFFEGVEKLLEIWFCNRPMNNNNSSNSNSNHSNNSNSSNSNYEDDEEDDYLQMIMNPKKAIGSSSSVSSGDNSSDDCVHRTSDGEEDEKASSDENDEPGFLDEIDREQLALINSFKNIKDDELVVSNSCGNTSASSNTSYRTKRDGSGDLRRIPRSALEALLALVKCEIISSKKSEHIDSYVLSESSLFVFSNRIILKTCGSTVLLRCVKPLLYLARKYAGFDCVLDVFYSHKNFMRPDLQAKVHSNFNYEFEVLETLFNGGSAYCFGRLNRDCWYYYTLNSDRLMGQPMMINDVPDQTLEIIMQQLDPQVMQIFTKKCSATAKEATQKSGINKIFNDAVIDDFLFEPCGYSMNGLVKGMYYFTIHITPEEECSFVSFETNVPQKSYQNLINKIIRMFNPGKFSLVLFANKKSIVSDNVSVEYKMTPVYLTKDLQFCRFKNYDLTYGHFAKAPS